jgi:hypothetical protein
LIPTAKLKVCQGEVDFDDKVMFVARIRFFLSECGFGYYEGWHQDEG